MSARMEVMLAVQGAGRRIEIGGEDRAELERIARALSCEVRMAERARIVLAASDGLTAAQIAERVGCAQRTVKKWRGRYAKLGMEGLRDRPRPGRPSTHGVSSGESADLREVGEIVRSTLWFRAWALRPSL
jgi:DNA-binding CsgD family transcriptional regulator